MQSVILKDTDQAGELRGLFEKQLKEVYWAEGAMVALLNSIIMQAGSKDLVAVLQEHVTDTARHVTRLEMVFGSIGIPVEAICYGAVECLIKEAESFIEITRPGVVRDAGIIAVLQKIKHYEIACYGTMRAYALALKEEDVVVLLETTLEEEKEADLLLSAIAESHINTEAADKEI